LEYASTNNEYFRNKYSVSELPLTMAQLRGIPLLLREEVQAAYPFGLICRNLRSIPTYYETSGSTGGPIPVFPDADESRDEQLAAYFDHWMGLRDGKVGYAMVALPYEMNPMGLKFHHVLQVLGITVIPVGVRSCLSPPAKVIELLSKLRPGLLVGRPLEIMRYAECMRMLGKQPQTSSVRKIFLTGETMSDAKFKRISDAYGGAEIYSTYGLTELDVGLTTCAQNRYHLPEGDSLIVEVLNESAASAGEGEEGAVVITSLRKSIVPYIRYRTGDVARYFSECDCGAGTPYLELRGREADRKIVNGKSIFPVDVEEIILSDPRVGCEYQLLIDESGLTIHLEADIDQNLHKECEAQMQGKILRTLGVHAAVNIGAHNSIADKFGIAKTKGCRFVDVTGMNSSDRARLQRINVCSGEDLR
jgi:phenylacetate-CoA ligase